MSKVLYVSDMDGTLLNDDAQLSGYTVQTIRRLMDQGVLFSVATARSVMGTQEYFEQLPVNCPAVLMNGTFLYDVAQRKFLDVQYIDRQAEEQALEIYQRAGRLPHRYAYDGQEISIEYHKAYHEYDEAFLALRRQKYSTVRQVDAYTHQAPAVYINALDRYDLLAPVYEQLCQVDGLTTVFYQDSYSKKYWFCESFSGNASKANGILQLKKITGADRVVVFGDNANDISMFQAADEGIAMANAITELKAIADRVIADNQSDGVARYLNELYPAD